MSDAAAVEVVADTTQVYYIQADHLNTPRVVTDANNNVVWQWENADPFGNNLPVSNGGVEFNFRFPGQYYDRETGLHYNAMRDYDPSTGRYIQSDPIGLKAGINTYAYVKGNPLRYTDPRGTNPVAGAIEGAEIGSFAGPAGTLVGGLIGAGIGWWVGDKLSNAIFNREKDVPNQGPPGEWIDGNNRSRLYGPDGRPVLDIDKPHQGYDRPHVHEWPDGKREHPGRDFCPLPNK